MFIMTITLILDSWVFLILKWLGPLDICDAYKSFSLKLMVESGSFLCLFMVSIKDLINTESRTICSLSTFHTRKLSKKFD